MHKIYTFMSTWEGSPPYPTSNREAVSLTISRKNDVQPCWSEEGTWFETLEEAKEFAQRVLDARGWNYETCQMRKEENKLITKDTLFVREEVWEMDEDGEPYGYETERNEYNLEELICKP